MKLIKINQNSYDSLNDRTKLKIRIDIFIYNHCHLFRTCLKSFLKLLSNKGFRQDNAISSQHLLASILTDFSNRFSEETITMCTKGDRTYNLLLTFGTIYFTILIIPYQNLPVNAIQFATEFFDLACLSVLARTVWLAQSRYQIFLVIKVENVNSSRRNKTQDIQMFDLNVIRVTKCALTISIVPRSSISGITHLYIKL